MSRVLLRRIKDAAAGYPNQQAFARAVGVDQGTVSRWLRGGRVSDDSRAKLRAFFKCSDEELDRAPLDEPHFQVAGGVPVRSYIGAGERVIPFDAGVWETVNNPGIPDDEGLTATIVRGDSMRPLFRDGWLVYYRRPGFLHVEDECFNGDPCVVETADGAVYVKMLLRGSRPGRFHMMSVNPAVAPMLDVEIVWATPVLGSLHPRFARQGR